MFAKDALLKSQSLLTIAVKPALKTPTLIQEFAFIVLAIAHLTRIHYNVWKKDRFAMEAQPIILKQRNANAQKLSHSTMVWNACHATCLDIGMDKN